MVILILLGVKGSPQGEWEGRKEPRISQVRPSSFPAALENRSPLASNSTSGEDMPEHRIRGRRGPMRSLLEVEAGMGPQASLRFFGLAQSIGYC